MGERVSAAPNNSQFPARRVDPHRLAWGILLISFAIFCVICVIAIIGVDFFLFQSTVPMSITLNIGRGSVGITDLANPVDERKGRNGEGLADGIIVTTDPTSQGTVLLGDPEFDSFSALITLGRNSSFTLLDASRPRFEWSRALHEIVLDDVIGEVKIEIWMADAREIRIRAQTPAGAVVNIDREGRYELEAASEQLRVFNRMGNVIIIPPDAQRGGRDIPIGGMGAVNYEDNSTELRTGYIDLLNDARFVALNEGAADAANPVWNCSDAPGNNPPSRFSFLEMSGLNVLQLVRGDQAETHGWTFCVQSFGQSGIEVSPSTLDELFFRTSFYIEHQSLGTCGFNASECPFTLRMDYIDADGNPRKWFHGFYTRETPGFPTRCDSETCREDHDRVHGQAWYTYESPNLLTFFQPPQDALTENLPDLSPRRILSVWLYASGHEYDVRVREVSLLASIADVEPNATANSG